MIFNWITKEICVKVELWEYWKCCEHKIIEENASWDIHRPWRHISISSMDQESRERHTIFTLYDSNFVSFYRSPTDCYKHEQQLITIFERRITINWRNYQNSLLFESLSPLKIPRNTVIKILQPAMRSNFQQKLQKFCNINFPKARKNCQKNSPQSIVSPSDVQKCLKANYTFFCFIFFFFFFFVEPHRRDLV